MGIGKTPSRPLDVAGPINTSDHYEISGSTVLAIASGATSLFVGAGAGRLNGGNDNSFLGYQAGYNNTSGMNNTFLGNQAGLNNINANANTFVGTFAGYTNASGANNTFLGYSAGNNNVSGGSNVFLGFSAGSNETGSNKLYIANSGTNPPLIYGDFSTGNVGLGTTNPTLGPLQMGSGAYVSAGGIWTNASSRSYKEEIANLTLDAALKTLGGLNPVTYRYKTARDEKHVGFIAEDVPDLVATKDRKGISPMDIVAVLTKVVQYQQAENDDLRRRLEALENR